eukprot:c6889_g1_i1.p1 GENE.c6889_g1_i1~~c6889_g1_i1.p1  ORF type:complete len:469 (-),score=129.64 c6889_g1_i1:36-1442(-)
MGAQYEGESVFSNVLPAWLVFDSPAKHFNGIPELSDLNKVFTVVVGASDGLTMVTDSFEIDLRNSPPVWQVPLSQQFTTFFEPVVDIPFEFSFSGVSDPDSDTLFFSVSTIFCAKSGGNLAQQSALPRWLNFDSSRQMFFGTAPSSESNWKYVLNVTASDGLDSSTSGFEFSIESLSGSHTVSPMMLMIVAGVAGFGCVVLLSILVSRVHSKWQEHKARKVFVRDVIGLKQYLDTHRKHSKPIVFISYTWEPSSELIVEKLKSSLEARGWLVIRDKVYIHPGNMVTAFMDLIHHESIDAIVPIWSNKYFRSENCMYELLAMQNHRDKVIPIINDLNDDVKPKVFSPHFGSDLRQFWEAKRAELEAQHRNNPAATNIVRYKNAGYAVAEIEGFVSYFPDQLMVFAQAHMNANFMIVSDAIQNMIRLKKQQEKLAMKKSSVIPLKHSANPDQDSKIPLLSAPFNENQQIV